MITAPERLLHRLEWRVVRRLDGILQGSYRTSYRGIGTDFAGLRPYQDGDDVRHIDWNVTSRLDEPHVRIYTEDRDLTAWLVVDTSPSMRFGSGQAGKDDISQELAVALARLLTLGRHRVGLITFDNSGHRVIPPRAGRTHVLRLAHELAVPPVPARPGPPTDLAAMLTLAAGTIRRRCLVFVISDLIGPPGWDRPLLRLAHRHEVVVVRVVDPAEQALPDQGLVMVEDAETGEQLLVDSGDPAFRAALHGQVTMREREIDEILGRAGVSAHLVSTEADLADQLVRMVRQSGRHR
jgi:uncharacterized protein (DUF58 family)